MTHDNNQYAANEQAPCENVPEKQPSKASMPHWLEVFVLVAGELVFALVALPFYHFFVLPRYPQGALPGFVPPLAEGVNPAMAFLAAGAVCAVGIGLVLLLVKSFGPDHFKIPELDELLKKTNYAELALIYVAAGIGEEMLFRVVIQDLWGLLPATLLFTVFHAAYWKKPVMLADVFVVGLLLGLLYGYTQSFWLCAAVHAVYNYAVTILYKVNIIPFGGESIKLGM